MRVLKWTGGILLVLIVALALFVAFGLHTLKGPITRAVSKSTGRELTIQGSFKPVWSWVHPRFRAEKVSFANPDWANADYMFQADAVEVSVELLPLFIGRVILPEVHLQRPLVQFAEFLSSNDVRNQDKDDFIFLMLCIGLRKQILQNRNLGQPRNPGQGLGVLVLQDPA